MKRDLGLVRDILASVRDSESIGDHPGHSEKAIAYHKNMLVSAGFIKAVWGDRADSPHELSFEGHEILDGLGNDIEWQLLKDICKELGVKAEHCSWEFASGVIQQVRGTSED